MTAENLENPYNIDEVNFQKIKNLHDKTGAPVIYLAPDEAEYYRENGNPFGGFIIVVIGE